MKKIMRNIGRFFESLFRFIDKKIIVPITKGILYLSNLFDKNSKKIEHWLSKKTTLIFISMLMALVFFLSIDTKSTTLIENTAEILYNQPVAPVYNKEAYVVEGLPETVDITLIGKSSDLYLAKQFPIGNVTLDLSGLKPGTHTVNLKYKQAISSINYKLDPSTVTIVISPKVSEERSLSTDVLNMDSLDSKMIIDSITTDADTVFIKGSEETLKKVASVKALIDINNIVNPKVGENELKQVPLIAYDSLGNPVDVEFVPNKVNAKINIVSPSKEVYLKVVTKGNVSIGSAISSITTSVSKVTIYGSEEALAKVDTIPIEIDIENLNYNDNPSKEYTLPIPKPAGIKYISATNVTVDVDIEQSITRDISGVGLNEENLDENLSALVVGDGTGITVSVTGVASIVNELQASDIEAYIDLQGYGVGNHDNVKVQINNSDVKISIVPKTTTVSIQITKIN